MPDVMPGRSPSPVPGTWHHASPRSVKRIRTLSFRFKRGQRACATAPPNYIALRARSQGATRAARRRGKGSGHADCVFWLERETSDERENTNGRIDRYRPGGILSGERSAVFHGRHGRCRPAGEAPHPVEGVGDPSRAWRGRLYRAPGLFEATPSGPYRESHFRPTCARRAIPAQTGPIVSAS